MLFSQHEGTTICCLFYVQARGHFPREAHFNGFNLHRFSIESASPLSYQQTCIPTGGQYEYIHQLCRPTSESIPAIQTENCIPFDLDLRQCEAPPTTFCCLSCWFEKFACKHLFTPKENNLFENNSKGLCVASDESRKLVSGREQSN